MLSAICRICSAASAGLFTLSLRVAGRTILRSSVAWALDREGDGVADLSSADMSPLCKDTGDWSTAKDCCGLGISFFGELAGGTALEAVHAARCNLGVDKSAANSTTPLNTTYGCHRRFASFRGGAMFDIVHLL